MLIYVICFQLPGYYLSLLERSLRIVEKFFPVTCVRSNVKIVLIRLKNYLNLFGDHIGDVRTIGNISPFRIEPDLGVNDV